MSVKIISGNLFDSTEQYLCHQCNVVTKKSAHLAKSVFEKFPYADVYSTRKIPEFHRAGTISIHGNGEDQRYVINMYGQVYPGRPKYPDSTKDGFIAREKLFQSCLIKISQISDLHSLAFPYGIGCGAAGGDWDTYLKMINELDSILDIPTLIYRL